MHRRPDEVTSIVPSAYLHVLEQVESQGWHTVSWKSGYTMLHWAASKGHGELCRYLMRLDADIGARDAEGCTAVDCATRRGHHEVALIIQQTETALHTSDIERGWLSLSSPPPERMEHRRAADGEENDTSRASGPIPDAYLKVMQQIDEVGWDSMQWSRSFTLLHWAAKRDAADLCARFLAQRADPLQRDASGRDAFDYAREHGGARALLQLEAGAPQELPSMPRLSRLHEIAGAMDQNGVPRFQAGTKPRESLRVSAVAKPPATLRLGAAPRRITGTGLEASLLRRIADGPAHGTESSLVRT